MYRDNPRGIPQEVIDYRRQRVARLRLAGLSSREVVAGLAQSGVFNPGTGKPYDHATICRDFNALDAEWRAEAKRDTAEHKARMLAELREVARRAAMEKDLKAWLQALKQEAALVGANAPVKYDLSGIDAAIDRELARVAAGGQTGDAGAAAEEGARPML